MRSALARLPRPGAHVHAFALRAEEGEHLDGTRAGTAEPVRRPGVELRHLAGGHDQVELAEAEPQLAGEHVHPLVPLVVCADRDAAPPGGMIILYAAARRPLGERDQRAAVALDGARSDARVVGGRCADEVVQRQSVRAGERQQQLQGRSALPPIPAGRAC